MTGQEFMALVAGFVEAKVEIHKKWEAEFVRRGAAEQANEDKRQKIAGLESELKLAQDANAPLLDRAKVAEAKAIDLQKKLDEALARIEELRGNPEVKKRQLAAIAERKAAIEEHRKKLTTEQETLEKARIAIEGK